MIKFIKSCSCFIFLFPIFLHSVASTWTDGSSNWNNAANWSAGVPNGIDDSATFNPPAGTTPITLDISPTLGSLTINAAASSYIFSAANINFQVSAGSATLTAGGSPPTMNNSFTFSSDTTLNISSFLSISHGVTGAGSLIKSGTGTIQVSGTPLTYGGTTTINNGMVLISTTNVLPITTDLTINGGSLNINNISQTLGSISGGGSGISINGLTSVLTVGNASNTTFSGAISNTGKLTKVGIGTLTLSGVNTYGGGTNINNGILKIGADNNLGSGNISFNGGTLETTATFSTSKNITLNSSGTISVDPGVITTCTGQITGNGELIKENTGILVLSPSSSNNYLGDTHINTGTLRAGVVNALPLSTSLIANSTFDLNNFNQQIGSLQGSGSVTLGNGSLTFGSLNDSVSFPGVISGLGGITKQGIGNFTLANNNLYSGPTNITNGTISCSIVNALSSSTAVIDDSIFDLSDFNQNIGSLSGNGSVTLGVNLLTTLTTGNDNTDTTFSGIISGGGGLTKAGNGIFILSGSNTYTGATNINSGILQTNIANAISSSTAVTVNTTFNLNDFDQNIGSLAGGGSVTLGVNPLTTLTTGNDGTNTIFSGIISGSGRLTKIGSGIFTLSGLNTHTGVTNINSGTLQMGIASALTSSAAVNVNGTFDVNDFNQNIGSLSGSGNVTLGVNPLT